jgi:hypothetical protein
VAADNEARTWEELANHGAPTNLQQLDGRLAVMAKLLGVSAARIRVLVSSLVVAQMLPEGCVVKGGIGLKLRLGEIGTRATRDVDVVARDRDRFVEGLSQRLTRGWGDVPPSKGQRRRDPAAPPRVAFTGVVRAERQASPAGVPSAYVMDPYRVTLNFIGSSWAAVPLEVAHDEIDGTAHAATAGEVSAEIGLLGAALGFGVLGPVPVISLEQQIAQKIHAVTQPGSDRAHDLVDLQILWHAGTRGGQGLDLPRLAELSSRTFAYRRTHDWPPAVDLPELLEAAYRAARDEVRAGGGDDPVGAPVVSSLAAASTWLRDRVAQLADLTTVRVVAGAAERGDS